jgi:hypothetical protein
MLGAGICDRILVKIKMKLNGGILGLSDNIFKHEQI